MISRPFCALCAHRQNQGMNTILNSSKQELLPSAGKRKAGFEMLENGMQLLNIDGYFVLRSVFHFWL